MSHENRVVVLIDMDCFYCQVEAKLNPELQGQPIAVVQYNPWKGGGIIAVNYEARAMGVKRGMRGDEAREKCPDIKLPSVPCSRGKADISKYRDAGKEVAKVLQKFTTLLERASIDEAYLDITAPVHERLKNINVNSVSKKLLPNTFALGYETLEDFIADVHNYGSESIEFDYEHAKELLVGAVIVSEIRAAVYEETGYRCSAGIAHNKILAKLVCGMNKPNKQTVLPKHSVNMLYSTLSVKKVKHLGGKFGDTVCEVLKIKNMSELQTFSEKELQTKFDEKNGTWLFNIARGIDLEPVQARFNPKSIGCCKQFRGKSALLDLESLKKWLIDLGAEIDDRLEKDALENNRTPKQMVVSFSTSLPDGRDVSSSRSYNFLADDELCSEFFSKKALELIMESTEGIKLKDDEKNRTLKASIKFLGISVGKFEDTSDTKKTRKIQDFFGSVTSKDTLTSSKENKELLETGKNNTMNKKGKEFVLQKFFSNSNKVHEIQPSEPESGSNFNDNKDLTIESTLDKQESFFARFLGHNSAQINGKMGSSDINATSNVTKPTTPVCDVVTCGEDSNDSLCSTSTINNEINKSIALFDEDPVDVNRVSNMRLLLNSTANNNTESNDLEESEATKIELPNKHTVHNGKSNILKASRQMPDDSIDTIECTECGKHIDMNQLDTHADYHLALKLREEERQIARLERNGKTAQMKIANIDNAAKTKKAILETSNKNETSTSIASFLVKLDAAVRTKLCPDCGQKVQEEKFPEHLDFHEAQKVSRELNKKPVPQELHGNSVKRKRKSTSPVKKPKVPCKSIASFFNR